MVLWRGRLVFYQYIKTNCLKLYQFTEPGGLLLKMYTSRMDDEGDMRHTYEVGLNLWIRDRLNSRHIQLTDTFYKTRANWRDIIFGNTLYRNFRESQLKRKGKKGGILDLWDVLFIYSELKNSKSWKNWTKWATLNY